MYRSFLLFLVISLPKSEGAKNSTNCDEFQANFDLKDVIGSWFVVAIIPEIQFPDRDITCHRVEFSETDEAGLRWLMNKTLHQPAKDQKRYATNGVVIRQRYYSDQETDVWSKAVDGVSGCFRQVLSFDIVKNKFHEAVTKSTMMQLHAIDDGTGPFLLQMLWGKLISVVVYRKEQGITQEQLKPVFELMTNLRGPQRLPRICNDRIRDLLIF